MNCKVCKSTLLHYENPERYQCPNGCDQSSSPAPAKDGTKRGGKLRPQVTRNPAKTRKNTGKRGDQGRHK
jgi:hypothetical protein